ncbi:retinol dehydrogenase 12 [Tribolium madens]|uniref:retinol dehydrogenase 12 n=1 Tax=Tribolium madens TaxID=41895 RepID=UPI001CF75504|nr:retinol dehydrogenase 12 [Tribolium madens]
MKQFFEHLEGVKSCWWPYIATFIIFVIGAIRAYIGGAHCPTRNRIDGKIVVITGGSSGIGLTTAKELAKKGARLILGVRNAERGKRALEYLLQECPETDAIIKLIDLNDFVSIREFANQINLEYERVDILINNAGIIFHPFRKTVDGNEMTISTNYFGPFLLTHLLLNLLSKSDNGRVINLSAVAHLRGKIDLDDLNSEKRFVEIEAFSQSKLALTMFTKHMASLLKHTNITFNAVNPGLVRGTRHLRNSRITTSFFTKLSVWPWMWLFMKTPKQGSQTLLYVALDPFLKNVSGCYFSNCEIQKPSDLVNDVELSEKLYKKTCEIVKIDGETIVKNITGEEEKVE